VLNDPGPGRGQRQPEHPVEARLLLIFGPSGVEGFFREGGRPAGSLALPPADEEFLDRQALMEVGGRFNQEFVGPPLPAEGLSSAVL
jgi:hypothetical protein